MRATTSLSLLMLLGAGPAAAGELNFSPDRPGLGDSTSTVGAGHVMVEGGLAGSIGQGLVGFGTSGPVVRFGLLDTVEARVRVPDVLVAGGQTAVGTVGIGAKIGGGLSDQWALSAVPELFVDPQGNAFGAGLGVNLGWGLDTISAWGHANVSAQTVGPASGVVGGGAALGTSASGLYANGALTLPGGALVPMVGAGGWLGLSDAFQLDAGADLYVASGAASVVPMVGASGGF